MTRALGAVVVALALAVTGCGDDAEPATTNATPTVATTPAPAPSPGGSRSGIERLLVGRGAAAAYVFRPADAPGRPPGVLFLHGWGAPDPETYAPWIGHLVAAGNEVIYPRYQTGPLQPPRFSLGFVLRGVRAALRRAPIAPGSLVVAGHSAGGALAADYAVIARAQGLPVPRAVFAVYPGRRLPSIPIGLPERDPARIPAGTEVVALAGALDDIVGATTARRTVRRARRTGAAPRTLEVVRRPSVARHLAPLEATPAARRTFWAPLDRLIRRARMR